MKTASATPAPKSTARRAKVKLSDALEFIDMGHKAPHAKDARERLAAFYARNPLRPLKPAQRGIVESLKTDRDRH